MITSAHFSEAKSLVLVEPMGEELFLHREVGAIALFSADVQFSSGHLKDTVLIARHLIIDRQKSGDTCALVWNPYVTQGYRSVLFSFFGNLESSKKTRFDVLKDPKNTKNFMNFLRSVLKIAQHALSFFYAVISDAFSKRCVLALGSYRDLRRAIKNRKWHKIPNHLVKYI